MCASPQQLGSWPGGRVGGVCLLNRSLSIPEAQTLPFVNVNRENIYHLLNNFHTMWNFGDKDEFLFIFAESVNWSMKDWMLRLCNRNRVSNELGGGVWGLFLLGLWAGQGRAGAECKGRPVIPWAMLRIWEGAALLEPQGYHKRSKHIKRKMGLESPSTNQTVMLLKTNGISSV